MKLVETTRRMASSLMALVLTSGLMAASTAWAAPEDAQPDRMRAEAEKLMDKARDLKAEGAMDKSEKVAREAKELQERANQLEKRARRERESDEPKSPQPKKKAEREKTEQKVEKRMVDVQKRIGGESKDRLHGMKLEIKELHKLGRHEEAERIEQKARLMIEELEAHERKLKSSPGKPGQRPFSPLPEVGEMERRLHHVRTAIENLHAAGLHEPAERLTQEARRLKEHFQRQAPPHFGPERPDEPIRNLQNQIQELRQAVEGLRRRLDEMAERNR